MKASKVVLVPLILTAAFCYQSRTGTAANSSCALGSAASPGGMSMLTGDCTRNAQGIAAAISRAPSNLGSSAEVALGRTPFGPAGAFDRCAVMARLAGDPRWTASIDSSDAGRRLRDTLQAGTLAPSISDSLASAGRRLRGVSLEKVLLTDDPAEDCPESPKRTPIEASVWLLLE